ADAGIVAPIFSTVQSDAVITLLSNNAPDASDFVWAFATVAAIATTHIRMQPYRSMVIPSRLIIW
ncbi:MAG: hypothetical protein P8Z37_04650, partial [Acidobacteriota bacterium]